ncbi:MAG: 2-methylthioadenine synthetase, partial [Caldisphaera sp.]|nr:2-methylthioadenine synthetase [Caldisphaera sp.]
MQKYYIETYGCALSEFDSSIMAAILTENGYIRTNNINDADIVIINTCAVRLDTEAKIAKRLKEIQNQVIKSKIVVSGCLAKARPSLIERLIPNANLLSPQNVTKILDVIKSYNKVNLLDGERNTEVMPIPPIEGSVA